MRLRTLFFQFMMVALLPLAGLQAGEPGSGVAPQYGAAPPADTSAPIQPSFSYDQPVASAPSAGGANCTVTCYRPVQKTREVTCQKRVCRYRDETRTCKKPVYRCETKTREVTCWKNEYKTQNKRVTSCQTVVDENGCCVPQQIVCDVPCQVLVRVPYKVSQDYQVVVCDWEQVEYTVKVPYWDTEEFTTTQTYCEYEPYEVEMTCCNPCRNTGCSPASPCGNCAGKSRWWL